MPELRMFALCQGMKWSHLPEAGGIYQQSPQLMDRFFYIMAEQASWDEQERKREEQERKRTQGKSPRR